MLPALDERRQDEEASRPAGLRFDQDDARGSVGRAVNEAHSLRVEPFVGEGRQERAELLRAVHEADARPPAGDLPGGVDEARELPAARASPRPARTRPRPGAV